MKDRTVRAGTTQAAEGPGSVPIRSDFVIRVFIGFAVLALISVGLSIAGKWAGRSIAMAGHTDDKTIHEIVIGNDVLAVPANMIRFERSRRDGVAARLDLYLRWPDMDGYSDAARDDFNHLDDSRRILFLTFEERIMSRDMSGRYEPIYRALTDPVGRPGPDGLTVYSFTKESGYVDEVLIVGEDTAGAPRFVARCLAGEQAKQSLAPCERDLHIGEGLTLTYRMPAELAASWREVDPAVRRAAEGFLQTSR